MARRPLALARCRVRDLDGVARRVARWGSSRTEAQRSLQDELRRRRGERTEVLRQDSRFAEAAAIWATKIAERREDSTADIYRHWLDRLVLPKLGELRLELYPRTLELSRALRISQAAAGVHQGSGITMDELLAKVRARFPDLAIDQRVTHMQVEDSLKAAGFALEYQPVEKKFLDPHAVTAQKLATTAEQGRFLALPLRGNHLPGTAQTLTGGVRRAAGGSQPGVPRRVPRTGRRARPGLEQGAHHRRPVHRVRPDLPRPGVLPPNLDGHIVEVIDDTERVVLSRAFLAELRGEPSTAA